MAVSNTPRFKLPQWSEGTDPRPGRVDTNDIHSLIETQAAMFVASGPLDTRPTAGVEGRFFLADDQGDYGVLYYDRGDMWVANGSVGGGGAGTAVVVGGTATTDDEGTSSKAARADHVHRIPLATATNHGAMPSQHAELLENASTSATGGSVAVRDSGGRVNTATPISSGHAARKDYVDEATADLKDATAAIVGGKIPKRWSDGSISGPDPSKPEFYSTKRYTDAKTWDASRITTGVLPYDRTHGSTHAYHTAWGGSGSIRAVHVTSGGELCYYSSTEDHKTNIQPWGLDPRAALAVEPVEFDRLDPETGEPTGVHDYGVRAEQAAQHLPMFAERHEDGTISGWSYMRWTTAHQVLLRHQDAELERLRRQNAEQAHALAHLTRTVDDLVHIVNTLADPDLIDLDDELTDETTDGDA